MANHTMKTIMRNFEEMLVEMPFNKITVSALVEKCEISANTFYYHFQDIYELLGTWLFIKGKTYVNLFDNFSQWPEQLKALLKAMQENPRLVYHVYDAIPKGRVERFALGPVKEAFYEVLKKRLEGRAVSEVFLQNMASSHCYSTVGFVIDFIQERMTADVDEAVEQLRETFYGITDLMAAKESEGISRDKSTGEDP